MLQRPAQRFLQRLYFRPEWKPSLLVKVDQIIPVTQFNKTKSFKSNETLELYHSVREAQSFEDKRIQSIIKHGFSRFRSMSYGPGVYLANHSRYAWIWSGSPIVLVCHVPSNLYQGQTPLTFYQNNQQHMGWIERTRHDSFNQPMNPNYDSTDLI
jgi:hypothetical protein